MSPRQARADRVIAYVVWAITGLLVGVAVAVFTDTLWTWPVIGLLLGLVMGYVRDRATRRGLE